MTVSVDLFVRAGDAKEAHWTNQGEGEACAVVNLGRRTNLFLWGNAVSELRATLEFLERQKDEGGS